MGKMGGLYSGGLCLYHWNSFNGLSFNLLDYKPIREGKSMGKIIQVSGGFEIVDKSGEKLTWTIPDYRTARMLNYQLSLKARLDRRKLNKRIREAKNI
jgi:hypothetical protein